LLGLNLSLEALRFPPHDFGAATLNAARFTSAVGPRRRQNCLDRMGTVTHWCRSHARRHDAEYSPKTYMSHVVIDGVTFEARRLMLTPAEVAGILRIEEAEVRAMVDRGELRDISSENAVRLDPNEVIALTERRVQGGELGKHVYVELGALISTPS
jgi:hypothetical protein